MVNRTTRTSGSSCGALTVSWTYDADKRLSQIEFGDNELPPPQIQAMIVNSLLRSLVHNGEVEGISVHIEGSS